MSPTINPRTLWTLGLVGLLVVLLAAINFVNLMTARAAQRAIEVGVRKSAGARRTDLIAQFLAAKPACMCLSRYSWPWRWSSSRCRPSTPW